MYLNCDYCKSYLDKGKNQCDECGYAFKKVKFNDWFDPYNEEHMKACKDFNTNGFWPKGFIPKNVTMEENWHIILMSRLAYCWVKNFNDRKN